MLSVTRWLTNNARAPEGITFEMIVRDRLSDSNLVVGTEISPVRA